MKYLIENEHEHEELCKRELHCVPEMSTKYCLLIKEALDKAGCSENRF